MKYAIRSAVLSALLAIGLMPGVASAALIHDVILTDFFGEGSESPSDVRFGTLIFPNERTIPNIGDAMNPTCDIAETDVMDLPTCQFATFIPDKESFPPFNNIGELGIELPDENEVFGFWSIDEEWNVEFLLGNLAFEFQEEGSTQVLTLIFGSRGNICGGIAPERLTAGQCFSDEGEGEFFPTYRLDAVHKEPPSSVPEPSTLALLGLGLVGLTVLRKRA